MYVNSSTHISETYEGNHAIDKSISSKSFEDANSTYSNSIQHTNTDLFDTLLLNTTTPQNITYEEYKNLTTEDIENLYPKENTKALSLHSKVNASDDEILNQVLFDKELEFNGSEAQKYISGSLNLHIKFWYALKEPLEVKSEHLTRGNIPTSSEPIDSQTLKAIEEDKKKWEAWRKEDKISADFLFEVFENNKMDYNQNKEYYKNSESTFRVHGQEILAIYDSIQREYEKRVVEESASLNSYTNNSKPNPLDVGT